MIAVGMSSVPCPPARSSLKMNPPKSKSPPQKRVEAAFIMPLPSAADDVINLKVEPVGYAPEIARLKRE